MAEFPMPGAEPINPLGLVGPTTLPVPDIETRSEEQLFTDVTTPTGTKPIDPLARESMPVVDEFAKYPLVKDDDFSKFPVVDEFEKFPRADDLDVFSVAELDKNREGFDPVSYFAGNPDVANDPENLKKLLDVYRKRREEGLTAGGVVKSAVKETPKLIAEGLSGVKRIGERAIDVGIQPIVNVVLGTITGDLFNKQKRDALFNETRKVVRKGVAEVGAGSESATVGLVDLSRQGIRKLPKSEVAFPGRFTPPTGKPLPPPKPKTDQELLSDISDDVAFRKNAEEILTGQGEAAKLAGLDKETLAKQGIEIDENAIKQLSLVDPITMVAGAGVFKVVSVGGKVLATARTLEGAEKFTEGLTKLAKNVVGRPIQGVGKLTTLVGKQISRGTGIPTIAGVSSAMRGAGGIESIATGLAVRAAGAGAKFVGPKIEALGKGIAEGTSGVGVQRMIDLVEGGTKVAAKVGEGAALGIAASAPFAVMADSDETAGALLGVGGALGAVGGAGAVGANAFRVVKSKASRRYFDTNRPVLDNVESPGYGKDTGLDTQHETNVRKLSIQDASELNNFREVLRQQGGEIYSMDRSGYRSKLKEVFPDATPEQLAKREKTEAYFHEIKGDRKVVYLNSSIKGLHHDSGHIFDAVLSPDKQKELRDAVKKTFNQEQINEFKKTYEEALGEPISDKAAINEFVAEQFSALFNNVPVTELNAPKSLLNKFIDVAAEAAESFGIDLSAGATTPNLGAPVSVGIRKLFQNAAGDVTRANIEGVPATPLTSPEPAPAPAPTATPAPASARPIRMTPESPPKTPEARAAAAKRFESTGIAPARELAAKLADPTGIKAVEDISTHMEAGNPVLEIEHLGITSEGTPATPEGRTARQATRTAGYEALKGELSRAGAPEDVISKHLKTFVPVRWEPQGGSPTLIAMSLDKVLTNLAEIAKDPKAKDLIPYPVENGKLTPGGWTDAVSDFQKYAENQANGRKGDGGRLEVPTAGELSIPIENPSYTPQPLTPEKANFQNLMQGLGTPETARKGQKGKTPGNIKGQLLAEANKRAVELPAKIPAKQAGKQAFIDFPPRVVKEVNPLRNRMKEAGVDTSVLHEVTERIRAQDIEKVTPRPDLAFKAPVTDTIRGGFQPAPTEFRQKNLAGKTVSEFSEYILNASPAEWKAATDNMTGGLTGGAWNLGLGLKDAADVGVLKSYQDKASTATKEAMQAGDFDKAYSLVSRAQFFREATEASQGTGSAGAAFKRGVAGSESAKVPFPVSEAGFSPSGEYWMDPGGKFIRAPKGHEKMAKEILTDFKGTDFNGEMFKRGYTRMILSDAGLYVDSSKEKLSDLSSAQRAGIEDQILSKEGVELTFNGKRINTEN